MSHPTLDTADCRAAIEKLPHLAEKMCALWSSRDLDTFVHSVLMDSREGKRQGLPREVAQEMMFVAKLNALVRTMDTASRLQLSLGEAAKVVQEGDRTALGLPAPADDPWGEIEPGAEPVGMDFAPPKSEERRSAATPPPPERTIPFERTAAKSAPAASGTGSTKHYLSIFLNEAPPIPPLVRIDLTAPENARTAAVPGQAPPAMSSEFFRCIAREVRSLGVDELVLNHLGCANHCPWLVDAIRFAKQHCRFPQVHLRIDPLNASEQQLDEAIAAGLDCLVIDVNMACKTWRARAEEKAAKNPDYLALRLSHILQKREETYSRTLHRCVVKLAQTGKTIPNHRLTPSIAKLAEMADSFGIEWLPEANDKLARGTADEQESSGECLCWAPFIEATVRPNGHLIVCAHDHLGSSYVADLKSTEFAQAWHAEEFRQTRRGLLNGTVKGTLCSSCPRVAR